MLGIKSERINKQIEVFLKAT